VERKFLSTPNTIPLLNANRGVPPFSSIQQLGHRAFTDIYYDHNNNLSSHGIWVRQRNNTWQAKIRRGGDYINSQFEEVSGWEACRDVVANVFQSSSEDAKDTFGLGPIARIRTERHEWEMNNKFQVVVDTTDFGHSVGEVELSRNIETVMDGEDGFVVRDGTMARLNEEIEEFMKTYAWAFPEGKVIGKLSAYFEWKRRST
jgi:thiamine-triphosphatase